MKVLFVSRKYPPSVGGMELFAYELSTGLAQEIPVKLVKWGGAGRVRAVIWALPSLFVRALYSLFTNRLDVIHLQDAVLAPLGFLLSRCFHKPYVVVVHGLDVTYENRLFRATVLPALRQADAVLPISTAAATAAREVGVAAEKIEIISLAVNDVLYCRADRRLLLEELKLEAESQILLTVGRLVRRKGVAWFITAVLPELVKEFPRLVYLVVGEGADRTNIEKAIKGARMGNYVRLLGRVHGNLYPAAYNGADMFVMPNINVAGDIEGFGLVLLEASLCALPIVAADTEGIQDAVSSGQSAMLVPVEDANAYVAEISNFLRNPQQAKQFGKDSRKYTLAHYSWPVLTKHYIHVYEKLALR